MLLGLGLAMDAAAVSMTNGMTVRPLRAKESLANAAAFGLFQGLMPLLGFFAGSVFAEYMAQLDHWIALLLLGFIGVRMLREALQKKNDGEVRCTKMTARMLLLQAIATSIDALAVGVSFAALQVNIRLAVSVIAATTFVCCLIAVWVGKKCGNLLNKKAGICGGCILILIGLKIFIDGMLARGYPQ